MHRVEDMGDVGTALIAAGGVFMVYQYLVRPLFVYGSHRTPARYSFKAIDQKDWAATVSALLKSPDEVARIEGALCALGFSPVVACQLQSHPTTGFLLYTAEDDAASATVGISGTAARAVTTVEFCQLYEDGSVLSLTNSVLPPVYPKWTKKRAYRIPGLTDLDELYRRFSRIRERASIALPIRLPEGSELAAVERFLNEELEELCQRGVLSEEITTGQRRFTVFGAYRTSLKLMWPFYGIALNRGRRLALRESDA
jgi:hypothetical protein